MFNDNHHLRDILIFGSLILMASAVSTATRASADEYYLCSNNRTVTVNDTNREHLSKSDACVMAWASMPKSSRDKGAASAPAEPLVPAQPGKTAASPGKPAKLAQASRENEPREEARLMQTSALVNAEEVPSEQPIRARNADVRMAAHAPGRARRSRDDRFIVSQPSQRKSHGRRHASSKRASQHAIRGLHYMGDGIYAR